MINHPLESTTIETMGKFDRQAQSQPKHGKPSVSSASKAPAAPSILRPPAKNSGFTKKKAAPRKSATSAPAAPATTLQSNILPVELQQLILDIFRVTFPASQDFTTLKPLLTQINDALIQKSFETAFGTEQFREGYAIRWSPSRALAYSNILAQICDDHGDSPWVKRLLGDGAEGPAKVLCFGGSAAEVMALAGVLRCMREDASGKPSAASSADLGSSEETQAALSSSLATGLVDLHLIDNADWSEVVSKFCAGLTTAPQLSKYASAAARAKNVSFLSPQALATKFTKSDILELTVEDLQTTMGSEVTLITLFFTLNDLYNTSLRRATSFLRKLSDAVPKGSLLLVIDTQEAAAIVESVKDEAEKAFPMGWLLDKALLPAPVAVENGPAPDRAWEKLVDDTNRLCKLPDKGLDYPAGLENLKLQVHLFRRI
jgi:25S rRNA (uracil2843-N3)-methyltransferase